MGNEVNKDTISEADANEKIQALTVTNALREPVFLSAIDALEPPNASHGLDAGCSIGHQAMLLAEAVGPAGRITGLDLSPEVLHYARKYVEKSPYAERIFFKVGDVAELPFDDDSFDWAWSMDCVGYLPQAPVPLLNELARVVKSGGRVAILAWSSERLLPGYPRLEARLGATAAGIAPFTAGTRPDFHFQRALGWFKEAGLEQPEATTFVGEASAPLTDDLRRDLEALFQMRWPGVEKELSKKDWEEFQRISLPGSPEYLLDEPDYYAFYTYSMFTGTVL